MGCDARDNGALASNGAAGPIIPGWDESGPGIHPSLEPGVGLEDFAEDGLGSIAREWRLMSSRPSRMPPSVGWAGEAAWRRVWMGLGSLQGLRVAPALLFPAARAALLSHQP